MDLHNERYFFLSGFISLVFFALLVILVGYSILTTAKIEQFAMVKSDFVSVSIALSETPAEPQTLSEPLETPSEPIEEPVEERVEEKPLPPQQKAAEEVPEIANLFSQVKSQNEPKKKPDDTKRREDLSALEKEIMTSKQQQRFTDRVKNIELIKPGMKMVVQGGSTGPVVNEYHAKIQGMIHANFHPPAGSEGEKARVLIQISAEGKLISYRIIAYSGNPGLNGEVDWLKERLAALRFPSHPENKEAVLECILTAKE
jgi:hypothetical protein